MGPSLEAGLPLHTVDALIVPAGRRCTFVKRLETLLSRDTTNSDAFTRMAGSGCLAEAAAHSRAILEVGDVMSNAGFL